MAGKIPISAFGSVMVALLLGAPLPVVAQIGLNVQSSSSLITTNQELTYSITLTNQSGFIYNNVVLNSSFNAAVTLVSATNHAGTVTLNGSSLVFQTPQLISPSNAVMELVIQPQSTGWLTNTFQLTALGINQSTNIVTQVYAAEANVGVTLITETNTLVAGDWNEFRVEVLNAGPETAPAVSVTNQLPAGAQFLSVDPAGVNFTQSGSRLVYSTGAISQGSNVLFKVMMQVNSTGTNQVTAQVGGASIHDTTPSDNAVTNSLLVANPQTNLLSAAFVSAQTFNPQTGLMEETMSVTNGGATAVAGARVLFPDLSQRLYNATGTNDGRPYVALTRSLAAGESATLLVEYFVPERSPFPDPSLLPWGVPAFVPAAPATGTQVPLGAPTVLSDGALLLEFPAVPGTAYQILYSDDVTFSNAVRALPSITAPADRLQWIDEGPPKTRRRPREEATRFYQVIKAQ